MEEKVVEEKTLTLKSLEKQVNEKLALIDEKIEKLEFTIKLLKKVVTRR